jgi:uncharacterized membrane protein
MFYEIGSRVGGDLTWSLALKRSPARGYTLAGSRLGKKYETGVKVTDTLAYISAGSITTVKSLIIQVQESMET